MLIRSVVLVLIALVLYIGVATGGSLYHRWAWDPGHHPVTMAPEPAPEGEAPPPEGDAEQPPAPEEESAYPAPVETEQEAPSEVGPTPAEPEPPHADQPPDAAPPAASDGAPPDPHMDGMETVLPPVESPAWNKPIARIPVEGKEVFLTFDDGPSRYTEQIASYLHEQGIPAAFFWLGASVNDEIRSRVVQLDHQLGSHTMTHARLTLLENEIHRAEMSISQERLGGVPYFRPPFGAYNEQTLAFAQELGMRVIMWDVDSRDWELADQPEQIVQNVMNGVRPGSIILLHERAQTAEILPTLVETLRAAGYTFGSLPTWP